MENLHNYIIDIDRNCANIEATCQYENPSSSMFLANVTLLRCKIILEEIDSNVLEYARCSGFWSEFSLTGPE